MEEKNMPLGMTVGRLMQEMFKALKKRTFEQMEVNITIEQFSLLHTINGRAEEVIQKDMAGMMGKDKSAIMRVIDALEEKELVRRVSDPNDRRKNFLMVTKKGERVIQQYLVIEAGLAKDIQQGLSEDELKAFYKVVSHMKKRAEML
jgi:MarR family transcriptional regulator for hemolysin